MSLRPKTALFTLISCGFAVSGLGGNFDAELGLRRAVSRAGESPLHRRVSTFEQTNRQSPSQVQRPGQTKQAPVRQSQSQPAYRPSSGETDLVAVVAGKGTIIIQLHTVQAPKTTAHLVTLAKAGFYDGQRFFKVINQPRPYLVQVGDPASRTEPMNSPRLGQGGSGVSVRYEATGFSHEEGSVALATADGDRNSGDSQFYITLGDYSRLLDGTDTVFGKVVQGLDIVHRLELGDKLISVQVIQG